MLAKVSEQQQHASPTARARRAVVILGGGFGGLLRGQALRKADADVTLIDRRNHHLFQPLLYQVATAALNPRDIAAPIRRVLRRQRNAEVLLGRGAERSTSTRSCVLLDIGRAASTTT